MGRYSWVHIASTLIMAVLPRSLTPSVSGHVQLRRGSSSFLPLLFLSGAAGWRGKPVNGCMEVRAQVMCLWKATAGEVFHAVPDAVQECAAGCEAGSSATTDVAQLCFHRVILFLSGFISLPYNCPSIFQSLIICMSAPAKFCIIQKHWSDRDL